MSISGNLTRSHKTAYKRANGRCEAMGSRYGIPEGHRCPAFIGPKNVQFGADAAGQCIAICKACKKYAAKHYATS